MQPTTVHSGERENSECVSNACRWYPGVCTGNRGRAARCLGQAAYCTIRKAGTDGASPDDSPRPLMVLFLRCGEEHVLCDNVRCERDDGDSEARKHFAKHSALGEDRMLPPRILFGPRAAVQWWRGWIRHLGRSWQVSVRQRAWRTAETHRCGRLARCWLSGKVGRRPKRVCLGPASRNLAAGADLCHLKSELVLASDPPCTTCS